MLILLILISINFIKNFLDYPDLEFYWGEWNSCGKKEGFGIRLTSNGDFYFGTFKNDKMEGLGLYAFVDRTNEINLIDVKNKEMIFKIRSFYSKESNSDNSFNSALTNLDSNRSNNSNKSNNYNSNGNSTSAYNGTVNNSNTNSNDNSSFSSGNNINISIEEKLRKYLIKNNNEENDYFLFIGQFKNDKFEGFGDIYDKTQSFYTGNFKENKITGDGKLVLREKIKKF
jgi:hypothetical protein